MFVITPREWINTEKKQHILAVFVFVLFWFVFLTASKKKVYLCYILAKYCGLILNLPRNLQTHTFL